MSELFKWGLALVITVVGYALLLSSDSHAVPEAQAHHWINDCRLLESNIDRGFLSPAQNRLQCGDVIENVSKADYDSTVNGGKKITTLKALLEELFGR
ncbi:MULTISPECIES: hypothetical protein [Klebsiella]|uniref:hypothetical protein n=1 Tax=Klebsiella TaxID=570 RepID=UPI0012B7A56D|nr:MULTISPECIES: hypothetical protein [Klebsiella]MCM6077409.1 hypothetical protein [Klebsiella pneumoniae]MDV1909020.1 hypothetical protein [Klebsiella pasteurii]MDV1914799.1 hypothetical protein [Klebsiella pasteurii]HED2698225.1 hypothetical protein [Klebsiella michiganensis]